MVENKTVEQVVADAMRRVAEKILAAVDDKYINRSSVDADTLAESLLAVAEELSPSVVAVRVKCPRRYQAEFMAKLRENIDASIDYRFQESADGVVLKADVEDISREWFVHAIQVTLGDMRRDASRSISFELVG